MPITLDGLIRSVQDRAEDPLQQLDAASETAAELGDLGDALLNHFVDRCRRSGHTWADIGAHLGVTRQAAQKRFVDSVGDGVTLERFTPRARSVLECSRGAARHLRHNYIGTEHLLLALFDIEGGIAAKVLGRLGVQRSEVEAAVVAKAGRGAQPVDGDPPMTPFTRMVLEQAVTVALQLGHNYIGTEHLLLGLFRGQEGIAKQILEQHGATYEAAQAIVVELLSGYKAT